MIDSWVDVLYPKSHPLVGPADPAPSLLFDFYDPLFPTLPYPISFLPGLFRLAALIVIAPIVLLSVVDILGWAVFKGILKPLGYASTNRFKDPEPKKAAAAISISSPVTTDSTTSSSASSPTSGGIENQFRRKNSVEGDSGSSSPMSSPELVNKPLPNGEGDEALLLSPASLAVKKTRRKQQGSDGTTPRKPSRRSHDRARSTSVSSISMARAASVGVEGPMLQEEYEDYSGSDGDYSEEDEDGEEGTAGLGLSTDPDDEMEELKETANSNEPFKRDRVPRGGPSFGFTST